ncbi:hypothetical protein CPC08DRAFT_631062 [Agrocybe pediades]|nr:hypothetical protein CPC08DRAFT_631062 [Agrocybe pediades]
MQYAPSPSLVGANDPLSRTSARAPVVTFGFGGKMITCFHGMPGLNAGFDVALSSRTSSELKIHTLKKIIPATVHNMPGPSFPGPLFNDPGTSSISLVRSGQTAQTKIKKASLVTYLADRYNEIQQGLGYLSNTEKQTAEDKLILLKLLSIMVENDGRLLGTTQTDSAVRTALVPRLENLTGLQDGHPEKNAEHIASYSSSSLDEAPISVTTLKPSTLDKIEELLLQGDRRQAYQFAMDQKIWAHAMIIASSIDKEAWKEVVNDFLRTELGSKEDAARGGPLVNGAHQSQNNRESLRVAYSLFSGQGPAAVQELAPVTLLQNAGRLQSLAVPLQSPPTLQPPATLTAPAITPRTPNFPPMVPAVPIPAETLAKWPETAAMIISSPLTPEVSGALTALGDQLSANNWVEAAHACYLLSSQTNLLGGFNNPSTRITLLGTKNPAEALRNPDVIVYSEILEFAMSLVPPVKGQEPFHGIAHLQTYRFMRAMLLCEIGEVQLANRYCEAIASSLTQSSPYTNTALLEQLQGLQQRLSGVFHGDKSGSWIGAKISKPSLDSIGGWLEGRFTKLVTGESDSPTPTDSRSSAQPFAGPFAHYSTISTTPSGRSSPQPSVATNPNAVPPHRTASAMATSSPYSQVSIERSSSAMGYVRQPASQPTHNYGGSLSSSQSSPTGYGFNSHSRYDDTYSTSSQTKSGDGEPPAPQTGSWWGLSSEDASSTTPTAATFMKVDDSSIQASGDGFISLMDTQPIIGASHHQQTSHSSSRYTLEEEDDDLGLGNSKPRPKPVEDETTDAAKPAVAEPAKDAPTPAAEKKNEPAQQSTGGSWFGRWWKRSDPATPGPIKASLGEESAFYYDKEQKRWINKKAGAEEAAKPAAPPPPPSRAQTASPGMSGGVKPPTPVSAPPTRAASAIGLSAEPPKAPMRIRSNLAPPTESAPSTPTGTRMNATGPPPPARPKSGAAKRSVRSRYVDVFQQEAGGPAA